ncbi:MAG: hypothetical protein ACPL7K_00340, partial [Armatimonadota bacterium]
LTGLLVLVGRSLIAIKAGTASAGPAQREPGSVGEAVTWDDLVPSDGWRLLSCGLLAALVGSCMRNLVDSDWFVIGIALPFATLSGVLAAQSGATDASMSPGKGLRIALITMCAAMIVLTGSFGVGDYLAPEQLGSPHDQGDSIARYARCSLAVKLSPLNPGLRREYAKLLLTVDSEPELATDQIRDAIRLAPTDWSNYYLGGAISMRLGDPSAAVEWFKKALRYNPNSTRTIYEMALAYEAIGDTRGRERAMKRLLRIEQSPYEQVRGVPELVDLTYVYAHLYFAEKYARQHRFDRAIAEYKAAIDRIERWRSNKQVLKMQRATGMLTPQEENRILQTLRGTYLALARSYELSGDIASARQARQKGTRIKFRTL